jgi:choline monooxygenase
MSEHLLEKIDLFNGNLPLEQARTIPSLWYFDSEVYAAECRAVFGDTWQQVGRLDQLPDPGSFFTTDIAGEPILVLRDQTGTLRAFVNVCRHRAARVIHEPCGKVTRLRCRYHGWTYDLAGRLRGTPEFEGVADFRREDQGLVPLAVETWGPLVWVRQGGQQPNGVSLAQFLAPLPKRTAQLTIEDLRFFERREYTLACNWKVFVDNYLDGGYHVNTIHPGLAGVLDYSRYRTEIADHTSVQSSPMRAPDAASDDVSARSVRTGDMAYYWWVFPNFMVNIYQGMMDTNLVLPLGPDRCRVIFDFFFSDKGETGVAKYRKDSIAVSHQIQLEDLGICEDVQKGLASRSYDTGRFSVRREIAGYHFHRLLARYLSQHARAEGDKTPGNGAKEKLPGLGG